MGGFFPPTGGRGFAILSFLGGFFCPYFSRWDAGGGIFSRRGEFGQLSWKIVVFFLKFLYSEPSCINFEVINHSRWSFCSLGNVICYFDDIFTNSFGGIFTKSGVLGGFF